MLLFNSNCSRKLCWWLLTVTLSNTTAFTAEHLNDLRMFLMIICCKVNRLWKRAFCTQCVEVLFGSEATFIWLTEDSQNRSTKSWEQQSTSVPCSVSLTSDLHSFKQQHQSKCSVNPPRGRLALCECLTPPRGTFAFLQTEAGKTQNHQTSVRSHDVYRQMSLWLVIVK